MLTYQDNDEHIETKVSNLIEVAFLEQVDDAANKKWDGQVTQTATNEEYDSQNDGAALALRIAKNKAKVLRLLLLASGRFSRRRCGGRRITRFGFD